MNERLLFLSFLSFLSSQALAEQCAADKTSKSNEVYWINDDEDLVPLDKLRSGIFKINADDLGRDRNLRFVGHIKSYHYTSPAAIKVVGWSRKAKQSTKIVHYFRGRKHLDDATAYIFSRLIPLTRYQKHHRSNGNEDDKVLKRAFHYTYNDKNDASRRTDDTAKRREYFTFEDVPKVRSGGLFARLFSATPTYANLDNEKFVYLKAALFNLQSDPCFSFTVRLPHSTERIVLAIDPIEDTARKNFGRKRWELRRE